MLTYLPLYSIQDQSKKSHTLPIVTRSAGSQVDAHFSVWSNLRSFHKFRGFEFVGQTPSYLKRHSLYSLGNMDSLKGEFSAMELPDRGQTETPGPLRIVKRNSRRISSESRGTNKSNGKGVKPSDPNGYLTVMKRKNDGDVLGMSLVDHDTDTYECDYRISKSTRYTWQNEPQTKGLVGSQTLNIKKTRRARPSIDDHGNLDAPCHRYTSTASAPLGEGDLRIEDFTNTSTVKIHGNGAKLALSPDLRSQPSRTSCVLCPDVAVTAEITALEDSQKTVWAAIEVSGRLSNLAKGTEPQTGILTGSFIDYELGVWHEFD